MYIFYYVSFYLGGRVHVMARVEIKGQFVELWSLLPRGPKIDGSAFTRWAILP